MKMSRMTLKTIAISAGLISLFVFASSALSQMPRHPGMMGMPGQEGMRPMHERPSYGYGRGPFDLGMMQRALNLTDEQMDKLRDIRSNYRKEMITRKAKLSVAMLELWEIIDAKKLDMGKAEKKVKELEAMQSDLMIYRIRSLQDTRKFLTDEQYQMFRELGFRSMRHGMGKHGRMGGGMMGHGRMGEDYDDYE
jgi:Spy/CpxP family protein refolding chaperone